MQNLGVGVGQNEKFQFLGWGNGMRVSKQYRGFPISGRGINPGERGGAEVHLAPFV